jgi:hypothetical protein
MADARELLTEASKACGTAIESAHETVVLANIAARKCEEAMEVEDGPGLKSGWECLAKKQKRLAQVIEEFLEKTY